MRPETSQKKVTIPLLVTVQGLLVLTSIYCVAEQPVFFLVFKFNDKNKSLNSY